MKPGNLIILLFMVALALQLPGWARDIPQQAMEYVRVAYAVSLFGEVDLQDAKLAIETWTGELGKLLNVKPQALLFNNLAEVVPLIKKQEVDMVVLDSLDYLHLQGQGDLEPILVGVVNGQVGYEFVLVANRSNDTGQLPQLRGKTLNLQGTKGNDTLPRLWLDALLRKQGLTGSTAFFGKIKVVKKSSQAVLPVFFNQADAAVTSRAAFDTLVELNPQIGKSLGVIAGSPRYLQSMLVIRKNLPETFKEKIVDAALKMNSYPRGNQIFSLFRTGGVTRFKPIYLKNLLELTARSR